MTTPPNVKRRERVAVVALLAGTLCWGCGFTWAKSAGEAVQDAAGLHRHDSFGPLFLLGWRFLLASAAWFAVFPASRRGWTIRGFGWAILIGALLGGALISQHIGLDFTTEAVSAFLTSLTILFVPLLLMFALRRPPRPVLWLGVVLATLGVWLMTGAQPHGFGLGEIYGLTCAFMYSFYILAINAATERETPWRLVGAQFAIVAVLCFASCAVLDGRRNFRPDKMLAILSHPAVWCNLALLTLFTTLIAFGLLTFFQPRIDPTRAALVYLAEPIFATAYAAIAVHHQASRLTLVGAALILFANVLVELLSASEQTRAPERVVIVD